MHDCCLAIMHGYHSRYGDVVNVEECHISVSMYTTTYANITRYPTEIPLCEVRYPSDEVLSRQNKYHFIPSDSYDSLELGHSMIIFTGSQVWSLGL